MSLLSSTPAVTAAGPARRYGLTYAGYVTLVLLFAYTVSFIDRQVIALLVQPIKRDLGLSDAAFSMIQGFAFAIFYTGVGVFLGRIADHGNRRNLILAGVFVWVLATASGGLANSFTGLFLARIFVGAGEAALSPAAYSMLADYFPPERRGRAVGLYSSGVYIGSALAFIIGGLVIAATSQDSVVALPLLGGVRPWQAAFVLVALPGLLVLALMLTVREPPRRVDRAAAESTPVADLSHVVRHLRVYAPIFIGCAVIAMITFGLTAWLPAAFIRRWGWSPGQIGPAYGAIILTCGIGGMLASGWLADMMVARGRRDAPLTLALAGTLVLIASSVAFAAAPGPGWALAAVAVTTFFLGLPVALGPVALQAATPGRLHGRVISIYLLLINLIGLGLGPFLVAAGTDFLFADELKVGVSLGLVSALAAVVGAGCLAVAARPYRVLLQSTASR
jgi:MFS family permease